MSISVGQTQGKSAFIKEVLIDNKFANASTINALWTSSGQEGTISTSLVNKVRSEMGLTGNLRRGGGGPVTGKKRGRPRKVVDAAPAAEAPTTVYRGRNARQQRLVNIEAEIDRLLFKVMGIEGLSDVEESLRHARRTVSRAIG